MTPRALTTAFGVPVHDSAFGVPIRGSVHHSSPFPKIEFPKFDGDNPRLWKDRCVMYFELYAVHESLKTHFTALNFTGAAAIWLQTVQKQGRVTDWDSLCALVFAKFDKDQYQTQLRHLEALKQIDTVSEYQSQFDELAHGILLYNSGFEDTFFVTKFVGGLKEEIRSAILLHRPKDVDTASALALI
jgi:hypothetical protein